MYIHRYVQFVKKIFTQKKKIENVIFIQQFQQQNPYILFYFCTHFITVFVYDHKAPIVF